MNDQERLERERKFHNEWASEAQKNLPNARHVNEALTSPELRYIHRTLAPVVGKSVLDVGCGLGEASVYFAICGADVTATDLSPGMLEATQALARNAGVKLKTHLSNAEDLGLSATEKFDIIYVGNLFHHVDIEATVDRLTPHLKDNGTLVSWDPVAYNPLINIYRAIATETRTVDEHPLTKKDVRNLQSKFARSEVKFFWFTSLLIFILMVIAQGRNPNKVRFWKAVVDESDRWAWLYRPLEAIDRVILTLFPFLGWLCWNVVIVGRDPIRKTAHV